MVNVESIQAVYAKIDNRPGTFERLARVIADRRINIDSIAADTIGSTGFVRFTSQRPREAVEALRAAQIEAYESPIVLATIPNRPGELAHAAAELAAAGINIEALSTTPEAKVALRTSDNERAAQILRKI